MTENSRHMDVEPGTQVGRYTVLHLIGEGGMGVVYAAYDPQLDRRIALKLLRRDPLGGTPARDETDRLLREAQSMARLSHPNVATVHDVGTHGDRVFIAMEYIDGSDLKGWLANGPGWREILDVFIRAGRGLAAAHAAGLVHRDFKPENVLLGRDGRVRVVDFGLAREVPKSITDELPSVLPAMESQTFEYQNSLITADGMVVGTPRYMAPERLRGAVGDARSDQFSFCLSLYEALYGEPPFERRSIPRLLIEGHGELWPTPEGNDVPTWIRQVLVRGLQANIDDRFPSIESLLEALGRDPIARRKRFALRAGAAALTLAVAAGAFFLVRQHTVQCRSVGDAATEVWNDHIRDGLHRAFLATGSPVAESAWQRAEAALDDYATAWTNMRVEACRATHITGEQSEALLDLRMQCLDRRLGELTALLDLFGKPDPKIVAGAPKAALALTGLESCADTELLTAPVKPPADRETRRRVARVREQLAGAKALETTGRLEGALELAHAAREKARQIGYPPLLAETLYRMGSVEERLGKTAEAGDHLFAASVKATEGNDQGLIVQALSALLWVDGNDLGQFERAHRWSRLAFAHLAHLGRPAPLLLEYLNTLGSVQMLEGQTTAAMASHRRALELARTLYGEDSFQAARSLMNIANAELAQCRFTEALKMYRQAQPVLESRLGQHPATALGWGNIGASLLELGRASEARSAFQKSLNLRTTIFGAGTFWPMVSQLNLAFTDLDEGLFQSARKRGIAARTVFQEKLPPDHPYLFYPLVVLGRADTGLGRERQAVATLKRAVRLAEQGKGILPYELAQARFALAQALWSGDRGRSLKLARQALGAVRAITPERIPFTDRVETWLAEHDRSS